MPIHRLNATRRSALFFVYAATLGPDGRARSSRLYTGASVTTAFLSASAMFGAAAIYGATTKRSLAALGGDPVHGPDRAARRDRSSTSSSAARPVGWVISLVGVVVFTALTAYDVQRIQNGTAASLGSVEKASVIGALPLYLDFINLFLFLLRLTGGRR